MLLSAYMKKAMDRNILINLGHTANISEANGANECPKVVLLLKKCVMSCCGAFLPAKSVLHHRNGVVQWCSLGGNGYLALSHIKVRRESDCKLNMDSSENITQDHCCSVTMHALYSRLIAGHSELR
ncbi:hypothetical protein TNCV_2748411 [Trichonephila clavipes]|nr:hypothetical protein TNCV_2748411 [Trichonephila clavipes]